MSALNYFQSPVDPFVLQKELGLTSAIESISTLASRVNGVLKAEENRPRHDLLSDFQGFVLTALWGNRMDLSLWPVGGEATGNSMAKDANKSSGERASEAFNLVLEAGQKMILANDVAILAEYVDEMALPPRMDIIVDNAGFELFCDLCLADFLIHSGFASVVHLQLKAHPTFVSDAMAKDVMYTIEFLQQHHNAKGEEATEMEALGNRWAQHVADGTWILAENFFWVQPQAMWQMPTDLRSDMSNSQLVFVKGDANYRRLLGDRDWKLDTPFSNILSYFPAPVCALRTLKAELGCGMPQQSIDRASLEDEKWLVCGKYGVVQFCNTTEM